MKIKEFFANFFKTLGVKYYMAFGFTVLAFIFGIIATAGLGFAGVSALPLVLTLLGIFAFVGLSLIGQERTGAAAAGFLSLGALVAVVCEGYQYFLKIIQNQAMTGFNLGAVEGLPLMIAMVVLLLLTAVAGNVFAWMSLRKKQSVKEEIKEEKISEGAVADEN